MEKWLRQFLSKQIRDALQVYPEEMERYVELATPIKPTRTRSFPLRIKGQVPRGKLAQPEQRPLHSASPVLQSNETLIQSSFNIVRVQSTEFEIESKYIEKPGIFGYRDPEQKKRRPKYRKPTQERSKQEQPEQEQHDQEKPEQEQLEQEQPEPEQEQPEPEQEDLDPEICAKLHQIFDEVKDDVFKTCKIALNLPSNAGIFKRSSIFDILECRVPILFEDFRAMQIQNKI